MAIPSHKFKDKSKQMPVTRFVMKLFKGGMLGRFKNVSYFKSSHCLMMHMQPELCIKLRMQMITHFYPEVSIDVLPSVGDMALSYRVGNACIFFI